MSQIQLKFNCFESHRTSLSLVKLVTCNCKVLGVMYLIYVLAIINDLMKLTHTPYLSTHLINFEHFINTISADRMCTCANRLPHGYHRPIFYFCRIFAQ